MTNADFELLMTLVIAIPGIFLAADALVYGFMLKPLFIKAKEQPGDAFIPLYNMCRLAEIAGLPGWFFIVCLFFLLPGLLLWRMVVSIKLINVFNLGELRTTYFLILFFALPIGCNAIGNGKYVYLLDEEQIAKIHQQGFTATKDNPKK
ncbi:MAG: DUF5684 domain-containing protein [Candidatus Saccharibacteria bacterium]|nr:DUF5684 domain-containing protein [Candidatus Saccharibacteria bacterium]